MVFGPGGNTADAPPAGVSTADLEPRSTARRTRTSSSAATTDRSCTPRPRSSTHAGARAVLVLDARARASTSGPTVRWFLLASAATVLLGALVAVTVQPAAHQPLREADTATQRIAAGDLTARVPVPQRRRRARRPRPLDQLDGRRRSSGRRASSSSSCCRSRTTCARRSPRSAATPRRSPTAPRPTRAAAAEVILAESRAPRAPGARPARPRPARVAAVHAHDQRARRPRRRRRRHGRRLPAGRRGRTGLELAVSAGTGAGVLVQADPDRLAQVVANLVENALKYARTRSTVVG